MKKLLLSLIPIFSIFLLWLVLWGDFDEWRYSKNLHCERLQDSRKNQICKTIEKYQEYEFSGHGFPTAGYRATFVGTGKSWCDLHLTQADLETLHQMQYALHTAPQLNDGAGLLYSMLEFTIKPDSDSSKNSYNSLYDPKSPNYLLKGGCI